MVRMLDEERADSDHPERLRGVFHCFGGPAWLPAEAEKLNFVLGIGGTLTFRNGGVDRLVADVPLSRIILETDAPYLAPEPHRGRRNEPAFMRRVAERLAELKGVPVEEVERVTTENATRLYRLG
jgi:TatD DNase family protein